MLSPITYYKSREVFLSELSIAPTGAKIIYHQGHLMRDRQYGHNFLGVHNTGRAAWEAMEAGRVYLIQEKLAPGEYAYLAVIRPKPYLKTKWTGAYNPDRTGSKKWPV